MGHLRGPSGFWVIWLTAAATAVIVFGLALVLLPQLAQKGFAWLLYGDPSRMLAFGPEASAYIALAHAVLGAVMVGWGVALLMVIRGPFLRGTRQAWFTIAIALAAWFVPDSLFSLWSGFWPNAVLNLIFLMLFALPLWATRRVALGGNP